MTSFLGRLAAAAVVAVVGFAAPSASALDVTFDFTGNGGGLGPDETFSQLGFDVAVESTGGNIHQNINGLGVSGGPDSNRLGSNASTSETLSFQFTPRATLLSGIFLEHQGGSESFDLLNESGSILQSFTINGAGSSSSFVTLANLNFLADSFTFRHTSGSGIRISALTVAAVPIPATGVLLLTALASAGFAVRRRKTA